MGGQKDTGVTSWLLVVFLILKDFGLTRLRERLAKLNYNNRHF
jgi:hypothetical protein